MSGNAITRLTLERIKSFVIPLPGIKEQLRIIQPLKSYDARIHTEEQYRDKLKLQGTSVRSMSARYLVPGFMVRDPFDNLAVVKEYAGPILIIHGRHDNIIPFRHGLALYKAAKKGTLLTYDCGHNDCPPNPVRYWQDVASFLHRAGIIQNETAGAITPTSSD